MKDFKIQLYRGDTKRITVSLNVDGEDVTLTGHTVKLVNRNDLSTVATATVSGTTATFNFTKTISSSLEVGVFPVMLVFSSTTNHVQHAGTLTVLQGVV